MIKNNNFSWMFAITTKCVPNLSYCPSVHPLVGLFHLQEPNHCQSKVIWFSDLEAFAIRSS